MMEPVNYFIFDNVPSTDFSVYCDGSKTYLGTEADITTSTIPGKNGDLLRFNNRYSNITVSYDCWIAEDMRIRLRSLRSFLLSRTSYKRLEDTYHPDEFRVGVYTGNIDPTIFYQNDVAVFTLSFNCKPQRFLKTGEDKVIISSSTAELYNPTYFDAKPLIRIYGNGTLTIGSRTITVSNNSDQYVDYDAEIMDAYTGTTNRNADVVISGNDFVTLKPGIVNIAKTSEISSVELTPRWYYL